MQLLYHKNRLITITQAKICRPQAPMSCIRFGFKCQLHRRNVVHHPILIICNAPQKSSLAGFFQLYGG